MAGVRTLHPSYNDFAPLWLRMRDVIAGEATMHAARERYLPRLKDEEDEDYAARVARSDFWNACWRTIDALNGMAFRKPPQVVVPKAVEPFLDDITMSGVTMEGFAKECTEETLSLGRIGILVDHPPQTKGEDGNVVPITLSTAQQMGLRPTLQLYVGEAIRNWKFARINNAWVLVQVVLGESAMVAKDEFEAESEQRYRVLDLDDAGNYRQRLFKIEKEKDVQIGGDIYPLMNGKPLTFVPFMLVGTGGKNDQIDTPPLIDLADQNVAFYQVNSDHRHALHTTALPTLFLAGVQLEPGEKIRIGGAAAITTTDPQAKGEFIEYQGLGLKSIETKLLSIAQQMALLGARMIADESKQVETLGATQIKRQGENSVLAKIVQSVSEALEWALTVFSQWAGASGKVEYHINRDFKPAAMDGRELLALVSAVQAGALSDREFFDLMQRGDVVDPNTTFEQHQEEIKSQPSTMAVPAAPPAKSGAAAA